MYTWIHCTKERVAKMSINCTRIVHYISLNDTYLPFVKSHSKIIALNFYTGLPSLKIINAIFDPFCRFKWKELTMQARKFHELMLVIQKVKLSSPACRRSGILFGCFSSNSIPKMLLIWLIQIHIRLKSLHLARTGR